MKNCLYKTTAGLLFKGQAKTLTLNRFLNLHAKHLNVIKPTLHPQSNVLNQITESKIDGNININKRYMSQLPKELVLMDFDVWLKPKMFHFFKAFYNIFFVLKELDNSFSVSEFIKSASLALHVVTTLLSELRFSELDGLLTKECKEEVGRNLKYWTGDELSVLVVKPHNIMNVIAPCDVLVFSDQSRLFVEVRVIFYVWLKYSSKFETAQSLSEVSKFHLQDNLEGRNFNKMYMFGVYNSKFVREFTKGVIDQWTINAINLKCNTHFTVVL